MPPIARQSRRAPGECPLVSYESQTETMSQSDPHHQARKSNPGRDHVGKRSRTCTAFHIILVLVSLQLLGIFMVALNLGGSVEGFQEAWSLRTRENKASSTTTATASAEVIIPPIDEAELERRRLRRKELDREDPRHKRILYSLEHENMSDLPMALDNYGSRRHFAQTTSPTETDSNTSDAGADGPYLVVGGSDGSGTRAIVDTLVALGTFFQVEDPNTKDIHGTCMFHRGGWPPLVKLALQETHSANYEFSNLSEAAREKAIQELGRLKRFIDNASIRKQTIARKEYKKNNSTGPIDLATATKVGWKAPVSMLLMPIVRKVFGRVKFLHVVRDGRDVCLSENQSPVKKFYNVYYGHDEESSIAESDITAFSIQMWNDMNQQAMEWGKSHSDGETFDYLMVRSEDLLNPETKLETLL